jgi:hypothetical protein
MPCFGWLILLVGFAGFISPLSAAPQYILVMLEEGSISRLGTCWLCIQLLLLATGRVWKEQQAVTWCVLGSIKPVVLHADGSCCATFCSVWSLIVSSALHQGVMQFHEATLEAC